LKDVIHPYSSLVILPLYPDLPDLRCERKPEDEKPDQVWMEGSSFPSLIIYLNISGNVEKDEPFSRRYFLVTSNRADLHRGFDLP
jgi:hypothetical protein